MPIPKGSINLILSGLGISPQNFVF